MFDIVAIPLEIQCREDAAHHIGLAVLDGSAQGGVDLLNLLILRRQSVERRHRRSNRRAHVAGNEEDGVQRGGNILEISQ